jgi:hypothetical protein
MKENEMGEIYITDVINEKYTYVFLGNPERKNNLEDICVDEKKILKSPVKDSCKYNNSLCVSVNGTEINDN